MNLFTIPIIIDDQKIFDDFKMTRASYYYIELLEPAGNLNFSFENFEIAFFPLEIAGVIYKPVGKKLYFDSPDEFEQLFNYAEDLEHFYIEADYIWIPNALLRTEKKPEKGDVFRISVDLFTRLYLLKRDNTVSSAYDFGIGNVNSEIVFSENETRAFTRWGENVLKNVIEVYPKNSKLELKRID